MSTLMFSAAKKPFLMPMNTGQRFAEAEPTVPIVTLSAARADRRKQQRQRKAAAPPQRCETAVIAVLPLALFAVAALLA